MTDLPRTCPRCQQALPVDPAAGGSVPVCPACGLNTAAAVESAPAVPPAAAPPAGLCAICQSPIGDGEASSSCPACAAKYHAECWAENGGCAIYGCTSAPAVEQRQALEIPVSYWGQEHKPCPVCQREILAAAVRCRHCGATFRSARPEGADEFQQRSQAEQEQPALQRRILVIFILCLVPCLAPAGAIYGFFWYRRHQAGIASLPSLYPALCKLGIGVAILQVLALVVLALLYSALKH